MDEIIEEIKPCACKKCIVHREIDTVLETECACTYKEVTNTDQEGNEYTVTEIDVKCDRCKEVENLHEKLEKYALLEKAYIDEDKWDACEVIDGVIYTICESLPPTETAYDKLESMTMQLADTESRLTVAENAIIDMMVQTMSMKGGM